MYKIKEKYIRATHLMGGLTKLKICLTFVLESNN